MKILEGTNMLQKLKADEFVLDDDITTRLADISEETDFDKKIRTCF